LRRVFLCSFRAQLLAQGHRASGKAGFGNRLALEPVVLTTKLCCLANDFTVVYTEELRRPCSGVATGVRGTGHIEVASKVNGNCCLSGHVACIPATGFCSAFI